LVVGVGTNQRIVRHGKLESDQQRLQTANEEEGERRRPVEDPDSLVIDGGDPAPDPSVLPRTGRSNGYGNVVDDSRHGSPPGIDHGRWSWRQFNGRRVVRQPYVSAPVSVPLPRVTG